MTFNHGVLSMSDEPYWKYGKDFLSTVEAKTSAGAVVYVPESQINRLTTDICKMPINDTVFAEKMQSMKFEYMRHGFSCYDKLTWCDFDTFFVRDWEDVFDIGFDVAITVREDMVGGPCLRAYANGGVFMVQGSGGKDFCEWAWDVVNDGGCSELPEYDEIWKTLEVGRSPEKTHYRTNLRWWCDQVLLSAIVLRATRGQSLRYFKKYNVCNFSVSFLPCEVYNRIGASIDDVEKQYFIGHTKHGLGALG
jgi:hypothetical protein